MSPALYEVLLGLWNVDELGKIYEWVTDDRLNLEAYIAKASLGIRLYLG